MVPAAVDEQVEMQLPLHDASPICACCTQTIAKPPGAARTKRVRRTPAAAGKAIACDLTAYSAPPSPGGPLEGEGIAGLRPTSLKNADAKRRLCRVASRGGVKATGTEFAILLSPPPDRLRIAKAVDLPPPGGGKARVLHHQIAICDSPPLQGRVAPSTRRALRTTHSHIIKQTARQIP